MAARWLSDESIPDLATEARVSGKAKAGGFPHPSVVDRLRKWELEHPLEEDGTGELVAKESTYAGGGLGVFSQQVGAAPRPVEYQRDTEAEGGGWLDYHDNLRGWVKQEEVAMYSMEVTLGSDWIRDETAGGGGKLRPMQDLHEIIAAGLLDQKVEWSAAEQQYNFLDKSDRVTYGPLRDATRHAAPCLNDALFGLLDGESDAYVDADKTQNALCMVPCLRPSSRNPGKVEVSSVWFYPRKGWDWGKEQEVTVGYHWPLEPWMTDARLSPPSAKTSKTSKQPPRPPSLARKEGGKR